MGRKGPRPGLDSATVLRTAADLVDAEGLDALTLARLAELLQVRAPSLYNHVASLDAVRSGLAVMGARELRDRLARAAIGKSGRDALLALADAYRAFAKDHPGLYAASLRAPRHDEADYAALAEDILRIIHAVLAPYGLSEIAEVDAIRGLRSLMHGFVALELAGAFGMPVDIDHSYRNLVEMLNRGLEPQAKPQSNQP